MRKPYFSTAPGDPAPLRQTVQRRVRFEEVDPLGIVWHGRYPSYLEDARVAVCETFGIGYMDLYAAGVLAPIKKMHLDYHRPLRFGQVCSIEGALHFTEAARINYSCSIRDEAERLCTTGYTVQLMLDADEVLQMVPPRSIWNFCSAGAKGCW